MVSNHTFPQTGDPDDAENFAQLIGQTNLADFVETGMGLTPDYSNLSVTVGAGQAYVSTGTQTASSTSEDRLETTMVVQVAQDTLALTDAAVNHVYVEPNIGTDDSASYQVYTDETNAGANALKIGEVDTSNNTATELNRYPEHALQLLEIYNDSGTRVATLDSNGDLTVDNAADIGGSLTVSGQTVLNGDLSVSGSTEVDGDYFRTPTYATQSDVPNIPAGSIVYIEDEGQHYYEDGS